jgi:AraC-like DNA-binding protein
MLMPQTSTSSGQNRAALIDDPDLLPGHPAFCSHDLEIVREYLSGVLAPHRLTYERRERRLEFRHRVARLGAVELNSIRFGGEIMVNAPHFPDYYLLQFMLAGSCRVTQEGCSYDMPAGSVAVINPCQPFTKRWTVTGRQILVRIERNLLEREFRTWTGRNPAGRIKFDQSRVVGMEASRGLTHVVGMLCEVLREGASSFDHPLVRNRIAAALTSALLAELPHNHSGIFVARESPIAPASVRRAERFMDENAAKTIGLSDLARAAGASPRALQMAFRRFRATTPMGHLRTLRLELARGELARMGATGGSVTSIANTYGFGSLSRFAADYKARFGESPSETLRRGTRIP